MVVAIPEDFRRIVLEVLTTPVVGARGRVRVEQAVAAAMGYWSVYWALGPTASPSPAVMTPLSGLAGKGLRAAGEETQWYVSIPLRDTD